MNGPYTELIYKTKGIYNGDIWYVYHPTDLRDKLKYKTNSVMPYRSIHRNSYNLLIQDGVILFSYEE